MIIGGITRPLSAGEEEWIRKGHVTEVLRVAKIEDRYLLHALEFEGALRDCLYRYSSNPSDVDDLLQETYARLLVAGGSQQYSGVRSIPAFCLTMARNVALDWLRRQPVIPIELVAEREALDIFDENALAENSANADATLSQIMRAIVTLSPQCRRAFTLRKIYGFSQKEIATELDIPDKAVEQLLADAACKCASIGRLPGDRK